MMKVYAQVRAGKGVATGAGGKTKTTVRQRYTQNRTKGRGRVASVFNALRGRGA